LTGWKVQHNGPVNAVAVVGALVGTASVDRTARLLDLATGAEQARCPHPNAVTHVVLPGSPPADGGWVGTGCADRATRILDAATGQQRYRFDHGGRVVALATDTTATDTTAAGPLLATANEDGSVLVVDAVTGVIRGRFGHPRALTTVALAGSRLAAGDVDGRVRLYDLDGDAGTPIREWPLRAAITALVFQPTAGRLVVADATGMVRLLDPGTGAEYQRFPHPAAVHGIAVAADGTLLATAGADAVARVFRIGWS
jgi:WD40 repeat protein